MNAIVTDLVNAIINEDNNDVLPNDWMTPEEMEAYSDFYTSLHLALPPSEKTTAMIFFMAGYRAANR